MKKIISILFLILLVLSFNGVKTVKADTENQKIIDYSEILDGLNFDECEEIFKENDYFKSVKGKSFKEKISYLIYGDADLDFFSLFQNFFNGEISSLMPLLSILFIVSVIGGMKDIVKVENGKTSEISNFAIYLINLSLIATCFSLVTVNVNSTVEKLTKQSETVFPILLALMSFCGQTYSVATFSPVMPVVAFITQKIVVGIMFPLITALTVVNMVGNMGESVRLNKFSELLSSTFKWLLGLVLGIFTIFASVKGISASKTDGVSRFAIKYLSGSVPIVGGFLKDGAEIFVLSASVVKNAFGKFFLFSVFFEIFKPVISLLCLSFILKTGASLIEPFQTDKSVNLLSATAKTFTYYIAVLLTIFFIYFVLILLIMISGGSV